MERDLLVGRNAFFLWQRVTVQNCANGCVVSRSAPLWPFTRIKIKPQSVASEIEETKRDSWFDPPVLLRSQSLIDAREVGACGFILIKIGQVYREGLPQFFCKTWIPLGLINIHVKQKLALASFLCFPLVEIDVNKNQRREKRLARSRMRLGFAPFEKSDGEKQGAIARGICECVLFIPDLCQALAERFIGKQ